jgi:hypothetical protein
MLRASGDITALRGMNVLSHLILLDLNLDRTASP